MIIYALKYHKQSFKNDFEIKGIYFMEDFVENIIILSLWARQIVNKMAAAAISYVMVESAIL